MHLVSVGRRQRSDHDFSLIRFLIRPFEWKSTVRWNHDRFFPVYGGSGHKASDRDGFIQARSSSSPGRTRARRPKAACVVRVSVCPASSETTAFAPARRRTRTLCDPARGRASNQTPGKTRSGTGAAFSSAWRMSLKTLRQRMGDIHAPVLSLRRNLRLRRYCTTL